jgi:hypothetical protein
MKYELGQKIAVVIFNITSIAGGLAAFSGVQQEPAHA